MSDEVNKDNVEDPVVLNDAKITEQLASIGIVDDKVATETAEERKLKLAIVKRILTLYPDIAETLDIEAIKARSKLIPELMKLSFDELDAVLHTQSSVMQNEIHTSAVGAASFALSSLAKNRIKDDEPLVVGLSDHLLRISKTWIPDWVWNSLAAAGVFAASAWGYDRDGERLMLAYQKIEKHRRTRTPEQRQRQREMDEAKDRAMKGLPRRKKVKRVEKEVVDEEALAAAIAEMEDDISADDV